jgi:pSer/pThr/pTyr-binding forkhead associated (FHA) protein
MPTLDNLESHLQTLLEVHLLKYLPSYKVEDWVYQQLAFAMQNNLKEQDGKIYAPNVYVISASSFTLTRWRSEPRFVPDLAKALLAAGEEAGFHFLTNPTVSTAEDTDILPDRTHIIASFKNERFPDTHGLSIVIQGEDSPDSIPPNAFLVMDGRNIYPLDLPVLNIGRRLNNQVIINDKRVSRIHAQLRVTKGRFAIFDLNSSGGTFVNGKRINKSILNPGDVISLAGVTLIYGQDLPVGKGTQKVVTATGLSTSSERMNDVSHSTSNINSKKSLKK